MIPRLIKTRGDFNSDKEYRDYLNYMEKKLTLELHKLTGIALALIIGVLALIALVINELLNK